MSRDKNQNKNPQAQKDESVSEENLEEQNNPLGLYPDKILPYGG